MDEKFTALIIEPRQHKALKFVLGNFLKNLDKCWNFLIYHGTKNKLWMENLIKDEFAEDEFRITLRNLNLPNVTKSQYSIIMTNSDFIRAIPTETFLVFQTDTLICEPHRNLLDKFMKFDYVGAPWDNSIYLGGFPCRGVGNGGLSLRKRSKMLEISLKFPYQCGWPEDIYFSGILPDFPKTIEIYKPSVEEAMEFSIETIYSGVSFGIHKPWSYLKDITETQCPGYGMLKELNL
jgi:hypothetical protein